MTGLRNRIEIRELTGADMARIGYRILDEDRIWGKVGYRRGVMIGYAAVVMPEDGVNFAMFETMSAGARPWWLAIEARKFLNQSPVDELWAWEADHPKVARWLDWLGFQHSDPPPGRDEPWVWRVWRREHAR